MMRRRIPDGLILALLFALPLVMFWQQTVGGRTLLPTENLFQYEPFATYREVASAPEIPHNKLLSDLVLENFQWKSFIRESIAQGEIPLWNPHQFAGIPFLAAGQQSTLYPFSILYYVLPLTAAYGWFTVVQLWLAGAFMYLFLRGLGLSRFGGLVGGVVYQLSAFFVISAVFPMIIASAVWLPLVLLMIELIIQQRPVFGRPSSAPWIIIGASALGCNVLAGHVEITYYTLIVAGYYAAARLLVAWWRGRRSAQGWRWVAARAGWLLAMVILGVGLGAVQFVPLFEAASTNFRADKATLAQVLGWAHPLRDLVQFALPNFYGNPSHHSYVDVFTGQTMLAPLNDHTIDWGIKNYVEGALYLGILPLALATFALAESWIKRSTPPPTPLPVHREGEIAASAERITVPPYRIIFALLAVVSLTFMFGLPTYALLYYGLPGINQLHSPFRWIYPLTLCVAALAAFGGDGLLALLSQSTANADYARRLRWWSRLFAYALLVGGILVLGGLLLSHAFYAQVEPLIDRVLKSMALASNAFSDARMFYSYQFTNVLTLGAMLLGAGLVFWWASRSKADKPLSTNRLRVWQVLSVALIAADLMIASWGFNPASDPALLDFTPPAIQWLQGQPGEWRYTTLDDPKLPPLMQANLGWRYGLDDIRGYESIIPKQYVDYMQKIAPQTQLEYNRVAPLYTYNAGEVDWNRLALLNVRYVITHRSTNLYDYLPAPRDPRSGQPLPPPAPVYEDAAVRIWALPNTMPRAYVDQILPGDGTQPDIAKGIFTGFDVAIDGDSGREKILHANISPQVATSWLVVSETYMPGWRAFVRPRGGDDDLEKPLPVEKVLENFQGINVSPDVVKNAFAGMTLPDAQKAALDNGQITVRLVYSPTSFQVGLFGSFISGVVLAFLGAAWLWRLVVVPGTDGSGVRVVARNSLAPILLNLFNRGIDFGFAFVMLRVLGPDGSGVYSYAVFIFGWFDIFTNFGLNVFLTREVSRDRSHAWRYLYNTSVLRIVLVLVGVALLAGFAEAQPVLRFTTEAMAAILLLYIGLIPNSLSNGMSALFYAFEKAEYPAAIATLSTICKAVFGLVALALGYGPIGLAAVSIVTNTITLVVMIYAGRDLMALSGTVAGEKPRREYKPDWTLIRQMVFASWPLMLNHFLATIFFQIDVVIIQASHGEKMVGEYGVAYKWLSALNVIPAFFTMALLPVMSRQAHEDRAALKRNYGLAIKLLVSTALPLAVLFTFLAYFLTGILGGSKFLPDGAIATQVMIWSIPIGWMNSLTQYVLIALDLQRRITWAFVVAVSFNIISNLILIPPYGYRAAAVTTILSEMALLIPFGLLLARAFGPVNWGGLLWRPVVATIAMFAAMFVTWSVSAMLAVALGVAVYAGVLLALRPFDAAEWERLKPLIPARLVLLPSNPSPAATRE
jgi:O-antigen/teichoic acid export membrane protein